MSARQTAGVHHAPGEDLRELVDELIEALRQPPVVAALLTAALLLALRAMIAVLGA